MIMVISYFHFFYYFKNNKFYSQPIINLEFNYNYNLFIFFNIFIEYGVGMKKFFTNAVAKNTEYVLINNEKSER